MTATLEIDPVAPEEVETLLAMVRELAEFERLAHEVIATPGQLHDALFGPAGGVEAVLARADGEVVGFALWFYNFSTFVGRRGLYLEDLFVRPAFRGRGYGEALLRYLAGVAAQRGCGRMDWAVLQWNRRAMDFYRRLGAEQQEAWRIFRLSGPALGRIAARPR